MQSAQGNRWHVILRQIAGYACLAVGIAGCILPIIPGIPFLFVGLGLLAVDSQWAARLRDRLKEHAARRLMRQRSRSKSEDAAYDPNVSDQG